MLRGRSPGLAIPAQPFLYTHSVPRTLTACKSSSGVGPGALLSPRKGAWGRGAVGNPVSAARTAAAQKGK